METICVFSKSHDSITDIIFIYIQNKLEPAVHGMPWGAEGKDLCQRKDPNLDFGLLPSNKMPRIWSSRAPRDFLRAVWEMVFGLFEGSVCPVA